MFLGLKTMAQGLSEDFLLSVLIKYNFGAKASFSFYVDISDLEALLSFLRISD